MRAALLPICLSIVCAGGAAAQERHSHPTGDQARALGDVSFANTGAPAAQVPFHRGLALLHSFEYEEAAEAFREASKTDPGFAMAYWGEALTHAHLLWGEDDSLAARQALQRLGPTPAARVARAGSAREKLYGAAIEALFAEADLAMRVRDFAAGMRRVVTQYPDDIDASAFAALALLFNHYVGELPAGQRDAVRTEAIALAERVFQTNPRHPGGVHYLIHATDDPAFAARGLESARRYAEVAPEAEHALHMPSHIFLQLGLWADVVAANERAWTASRAEVVARKLSNAELSFHALQWLQYGYLQQGRYRAARALIDTARAVLNGVDLANPVHADARYTIAWLEFMHAAHSGEWTAVLCSSARAATTTPPAESDRERAFQANAAVRTAVSAVMCGSARPGSAEPPVLVAALAAYQAGEHERAIALLGPIVSARTQPPVGPPMLPRAHELFGAALLKAGRARDAVRAYEQALQSTPKRSQALLGLARARTAAGDPAGARDAYRQLLVNWQNADRGIDGLAEATSAIQAN
ncbi:MAG TPA: tetratricopeptide repeat protein [Longimicrobiales bacterium]|nr:tetratricopeptide repeat protein [Longimicrobiales bacterium]